MRNFLLNIFIFALYPYVVEPKTSYRIISSGRFSCGFNAMGCLGPLYVVCQVVGLRGRWAYSLAGMGLKATILTMPSFFFD